MSQDGEANGQGPTILVVEDLPGNVLLVRAILSRQGYQVAVARTLASARDWLVKSTAALVLLDLQLPDGNGLDLVRDLRRAGGPGAELPVLAISAHRDPNIEEAAIKAGCNGFIRKPVNIHELKSRITEELRLTSPGPAREPGPETDTTEDRLATLRRMSVAELGQVDWRAEAPRVRALLQAEAESLIARLLIID